MPTCPNRAKLVTTTASAITAARTTAVVEERPAKLRLPTWRPSRERAGRCRACRSSRCVEHGCAPAETQVEHIGERDGEPDERGDERDGNATIAFRPAESKAHREHDEPAPPDQPVRDGSSAVIRVGEDDDRDSEEARRRGWWQRFLS